MQYCEYDHPLGFNAVEDGVGEARNKGAPHLAVRMREHFWIALDGVECGIDSGKELFAKAFGLPLVVPEPASEIPSNLPTVDNRESH